MFQSPRLLFTVLPVFTVHYIRFGLISSTKIRAFFFNGLGGNFLVTDNDERNGTEPLKKFHKKAKEQPRPILMDRAWTSRNQFIYIYIWFFLRTIRSISAEQKMSDGKVEI